MPDEEGPTPWARRGGPSGPTGDETVAHPPLAAAPPSPAAADPADDDPTLATSREEDRPTLSQERDAAPPVSQERSPSEPPAPRRRKGGGGVDPLTAVAVGGVVVLAVAIAVMVAALGSGGDDDDAATTTTSTTSASEVASETSTAEATTTTGPDDATTVPPVDPPTIAELGPDLRCADLTDAGAPYGMAVVYWATHGESALLDADVDGIPCETTYPAADVALLWRESDDPTVTDGLADGLLCRDLVGQDIDYPDAAGYWAAQGRPERMDDDGNAIPCETTYPAAAVTAFWG